jgi:alpha-tubulin suppressor-like RCC1 family protein
VSTGRFHSCAIKTDGTIVCWGSNALHRVRPPPCTFTAISSGPNNSCGVRTDGGVDCWGDDAVGQSTTPPGFNQ